MSNLDIGLLQKLLKLNPQTGKLYWCERPVEMFSESNFTHRTGKVATRPAEWACKIWNTKFAGKEAMTSKCASGARAGRIFGELYYAHIVVWALHHGAWPENSIDHQDGDRGNNKIRNLRDVTHQVNMKNKKLYKTNVSGCHGVSFSKYHNRWQAYITVDKKRKHIGFFKNQSAAAEARKSAECKSEFHLNHGRTT